MNLKEFLQAVTTKLEQEKLQYALAGGMAASIYRVEERTTKDLDFLLFSEAKTIERAEEVIRSFGLNPRIARAADLAGGPLFAIKNKNSDPQIVVGTNKDDPRAIGLDFILPEMPWAKEALERAQLNRLDFGFAEIPTVTVEDIILAKLHAVSGTRQREKDLDDLRSIFKAGHTLDYSYLRNRCVQLSVRVPASLKDEAPKKLVKLSRGIKKTL